MTVRRPLVAPLLFGLLALLASSDPREAMACGTAFPLGKPVEIADETAIIVWDAATKTQHFIRRASFRSAADDFGFLVPTPTQPILAEASEAAFALLAKVTEPKTIERTVGAIKMGCGGRGGSKYAGDVTVLESKRVAGYDAAVLESDNADALVRWLQDHNYDYSPALKEWLEPYVAAKWIVTAFKVARYDAKDPQTATSAVRMSFRTERPFFPYREPKSEAASMANSGRRLLRVFFVGETRVDGYLGEAGSKWPGKPVWSNRLKPETRAELLEDLKLPESAAPPKRC